MFHSLGTLFWFNEESLREHVLLDIRRVAVAMTRVISVRFWAESGLQHSAIYKNQLLDSKLSQAELRRLNTEGLATRKLLKELWRNDFSPEDHDAMTSIILKIMVQKSLILNRGFADEFIVPCCLPSATVPESPDEAAEVRYVNLDGLVSPAILSQIAELMCKKENNAHELSPGPPQVFRNHVEFTSNEAITHDRLVTCRGLSTPPDSGEAATFCGRRPSGGGGRATGEDEERRDGPDHPQPFRGCGH